MKTKSIKYILAAGLVCCGLSTTVTSCSDVLDEQPRSQFDPTFFTTKTGIEGGLTSLYPMHSLLMVTSRMPTSLVWVP